jgi:hypothetical protein
VFKGREAKLNKTIFTVLSRKGSLTVYALLKEIKKQRGFTDTRYSVISRRVEALEKQDYLMKVGAIKARWGYDTPLFSLTPRAELAIVLSTRDLDQLIKEMEYHLVIDMLGILQIPFAAVPHKTGRKFNQH